MAIEFDAKIVESPATGVRGVVPSDGVGAEELAEFKAPKDQVVRCRIWVTRSNPRNAWWHALVGAVAKGIGKPPKMVKWWLKLQLGLIGYEMVGGEEVPFEQSTAFDKMDEDDFWKFCDASVEIICRELLPGVEAEEVIAQVEEMLTDNRGTLPVYFRRPEKKLPAPDEGESDG